MKIIYKNFFILLVLVSGFSQAQMTVLDDDDNVIQDGTQFNFDTVNEDPAKLHFYIKNDFSNEIEIKAVITEMIGADGTNVQFCIGECLFSVSEGTEVPENGTFLVPANSTTAGPGTYFWNLDDTNSPITYKFKIYQVDALGNETGDPTNITYVYDSNLSTDKNTLSETKIYPSVTSDIINIELTEEASIEIFDLQGKMINSRNLPSGRSMLNVSNFSNGVYLIKIQAENNKFVTKKFVKK